tara:strand:- start:43 stop:444 length:402 start_codon:yes stop_codon:yes gene_type:complete
MSKNNTKSVKTQKTSPSKFFDGISTTSGVSESTRLTLEGSVDAIRDALKEAKVKTKQVHLILGYIDVLGGNALVKDIDAYSIKATGSATWGKNEYDLYVQPPSKVLRTYIDAMAGLVKWDVGARVTLKVISTS